MAPGLLAYATFMTAMFQALFGAFIRMRYQRTWEGQLTTQIELSHVVWGEVLWAGLLATMYVAIVALVLVVLRSAGVLDIAVWLSLPCCPSRSWPGAPSPRSGSASRQFCPLSIT